jgi:hypothetical protein
MHHAAMANKREMMLTLARLGCDYRAKADGIDGATAAFVLCGQHGKSSQQQVRSLPHNTVGVVMGVSPTLSRHILLPSFLRVQVFAGLASVRMCVAGSKQTPFAAVCSMGNKATQLTNVKHLTTVPHSAWLHPACAADGPQHPAEEGIQGGDAGAGGRAFPAGGSGGHRCRRRSVRRRRRGQHGSAAGGARAGGGRVRGVSGCFCKWLHAQCLPCTSDQTHVRLRDLTLLNV